MDIKQMVVEDMTRAVSFILLYAFIFLVAKLVKDVLTPYKLNDDLAKNDNVAIALAISLLPLHDHEEDRGGHDPHAHQTASAYIYSKL